MFGADNTGLEESFGPQTSLSFVFVIEVSAVAMSETGNERSRIVGHYRKMIMGRHKGIGQEFLIGLVGGQRHQVGERNEIRFVPEQDFIVRCYAQMVKISHKQY